MLWTSSEWKEKPRKIGKLSIKIRNFHLHFTSSVSSHWLDCKPTCFLSPCREDSLLSARTYRGLTAFRPISCQLYDAVSLHWGIMVKCKAKRAQSTKAKRGTSGLCQNNWRKGNFLDLTAQALLQTQLPCLRCYLVA